MVANGRFYMYIYVRANLLRQSLFFHITAIRLAVFFHGESLVIHIDIFVAFSMYYMVNKITSEIQYKEYVI